LIVNPNIIRDIEELQSNDKVSQKSEQIKEKEKEEE